MGVQLETHHRQHNWYKMPPERAPHADEGAPGPILDPHVAIVIFTIAVDTRGSLERNGGYWWVVAAWQVTTTTMWGGRARREREKLAS